MTKAERLFNEVMTLNAKAMDIIGHQFMYDPFRDSGICWCGERISLLEYIEFTK